MYEKTYSIPLTIIGHMIGNLSIAALGEIAEYTVWVKVAIVVFLALGVLASVWVTGNAAEGTARTDTDDRALEEL